MNTDSIFFLEKKPVKKIALLFTIPCAIVPVMFAAAGLMSIPFGSLLFRFDFILFGAIYSIYFYGLLVSWQLHKNWIPFSLFAVNLLSLLFFIFHNPTEWLGYICVFSIMATSVSNQYFRVGTFACNEDCKI